MSRRSPETDSPAADSAQSSGGESPGDLALVEYMRRIDRGERVDRRQFLAEYPEAADELAEYFAATTEFDHFVGGINLGFTELAPAESLQSPSLHPPVSMRPPALDEDSQDLSSYQGVILVDGVDPEAPEAQSAEPEPESDYADAAGPNWNLRLSILGGAGLAAAALVTGVFWLPGLINTGQRLERLAPNAAPFVSQEAVWVMPPPLLEIYTDQKADFAPFQPARGLNISRFEPFAGKRSLVIDRYVHSDMLPNFPLRIKEKPLGGEYRYLRFAWRKETPGPIAFVLWGPRRYIYYAGGHRITPADVALDLGDAPKTWKTVERDIFEDFGPIQLRGIALFVQTGESANFDQISLSATREAFAPWDGSPHPDAKADPTVAAKSDMDEEQVGANLAPAEKDKPERKVRLRPKREREAPAPVTPPAPLTPPAS